MVKALDAPRTVWVMVPAGAATQDTIVKLGDMLDKGDLVIDGGNSRFTDDIEHAKMLKAKGIGFVDCGVSGGIWGLQNGYGLMVGGETRLVNRVMPIFDALRPEGPRDEGFVHAGDVGAGPLHEDGPQRDRVRSHGGLRRGLRAAREEGHRQGRPRRVQGVEPRHRRPVLAARPRGRRPRGEPDARRRLRLHRRLRRGKWTVEEAVALDVPMPVISASLFARFASRQEVSPTMQMVAALRGQFGGHPVMTIREAKTLRRKGIAGDWDIAPAAAKAAVRKSVTKGATAKKASTKKAAAKKTAKKTAVKS